MAYKDNMMKMGISVWIIWSFCGHWLFPTDEFLKFCS
jgi:hypothetical protein